MEDRELQAIIDRQIGAAIGSSGAGGGSELADQRKKALDYYYGEPFGNEVDGRSEVVIRDVADTVEWLLPSLVKVFLSGDEIVSFSPQGMEDEEGAKQATEYVSYIFMRDNPGFTILYDLFKDGLLQKNGYVKVYWEDTEETARETFTGLTPEDVGLILRGEEGEEAPEPIAYTFDPITGLADLKVERMVADGRVRIESVPPEEMLISRRATTIKDAPFVAHRVQRTVTELIEQGFDEELVNSIPSQADGEFNEERTASDQLKGASA